MNFRNYRYILLLLLFTITSRNGVIQKYDYAHQKMQILSIDSTFFMGNGVVPFVNGQFHF